MMNPFLFKNEGKDQFDGGFSLREEIVSDVDTSFIGGIYLSRCLFLNKGEMKPRKAVKGFTMSFQVKRGWTMLLALVVLLPTGGLSMYRLSFLFRWYPTRDPWMQEDFILLSSPPLTIFLSLILNKLVYFFPFLFSTLRIDVLEFDYET